MVVDPQESIGPGGVYMSGQVGGLNSGIAAPVNGGTMNGPPAVAGPISGSSAAAAVAAGELAALVEQDIPDGRRHLQESFTNLEKVAEYCETNYFQSDNKRAALEVTKNYTTQSLASVAYQINNLACSLLQMLDMQTAQLSDMESQVNHLTQTVSIHKEKVARREIGVLTTNKTVMRQHKILMPATPERPVKYVRRPIDYSLLDDIGHGVKLAQSNMGRHVKRTSSASAAHHYGATGQYGTTGGLPPMNGSMTLSHHHYGTTGGGVSMTNKPPTPPQAVRSGMGTLSRASKEYRTPAPPIAPPQVPSNYAPNYPIGHPRANHAGGSDSGTDSRRGSGYSTLPSGGSGQNHIQAAMAAQGIYGQHGISGVNMPIQQRMNEGLPPPLQNQQQGQVVGKVHPYNVAGHGQGGGLPPTPPPPPMPNDVLASPAISDSMPEPPVNLRMSNMDHGHYMHTNRSSSPPLPPPPMDEHVPQVLSGHSNYGMTGPAPPPPPPSIPSQAPHGHVTNGARAGHQEPEWVPKNYLEKVVAIYDYTANADDELTFSDNAIIYVIRKNDDGWYEGVLDGVTGLFPGNYVEACL